MNAVIRRIRRLEGQFAPGNRKPRQTFRIVVRSTYRTPSLETVTCGRTLCPAGTLMELVEFDASREGHDALTSEQLDEWIAGFPVE
jgi:hypothetical protein